MKTFLLSLTYAGEKRNRAGKILQESTMRIIKILLSVIIFILLSCCVNTVQAQTGAETDKNGPEVSAPETMVIILTSGTALKGQVIGADDNSVTLKAEDGQTTKIPKAEISRRITPDAFAKQVGELIRLLGNDDWNIRDAATSKLRKLGAIITPDLEAALDDPDAEIAYRAQALLRGIGLHQFELNVSWEDIAREVANERPENWERYFAQAQTDMAADNLKKAEREYIKAVIISRRLNNVIREGAAPACFGLASLYASRNDWASAIQCYEEGLARSPWRGDINYLLAECYEKNGDHNRALERYRISVGLEPGHQFAAEANSRITLLTEQSQTGHKNVQDDISIKRAQVIILPIDIDQPERINRLKEIAVVIGENLGITIVVGKPVNLLKDSFLVERRKYDAEKLSAELEELYDKDYAGKAANVIGVTKQDITIGGCNYVFAQTRDRASIVSYARMREEFHRLPGDERLLRRRLTAQITTSIGRTMDLSGCNKPVCAMSYVNSLGELDKRALVFCDDCSLLFKGYVLGYLGEYEPAFKLIDAYIKRCPNDSAPHYKKALFYWKLEDWDKVIAEFESVLKIDPTNINAKNGLIRAKSYQKKK